MAQAQPISINRHPYADGGHKKMLIDGKWLDAASGKTFESRNPATGELLATVAEGDAEDINRAVAAARRAFEGPWSKVKPYERQNLLLKLADLVEKNFDELSTLDTLDMGAPISRTRATKQRVLGMLRYYAGQATALHGETIENSLPGDIFSYTLKEPVGVVGAIIPWNGPLGASVWKIGPAIATGCTVILKPAELAMEEAMGRAAEVVATSSSHTNRWRLPVAQVNDLSRNLTAFDPISTLVVVLEMSKASWLVSGVVPGVERQPLKKLEPDATALLRLIERWRNEAVRAGRPISRIALAYEAGRDGFWLARWLIARGIEAHVIHSASVAVSRERKRAKTDRLDAAMLMRVFLGWLRGERGHCGMVAIPTMEEEDARRPSRERASLVDERSRITNRMKSALARLGIRGFKPHLRKAPERLAGLRTAEGTGLPANIIEEFRRDMARLALVREQISSIEKTRAERLDRAPDTGPHAMVRLLARVIGIGIETADMLVREILSRRLRDRRAVARYAGLTGSPDESGLKRREKGLAKAGNARVRRGLIQLAWRFLMFQKDSALARWYRTRTEGPSGARKTTMIVALARKLLIALWRLVTTGEVPDGVELRPAAACAAEGGELCAVEGCVAEVR